MRFVSVAVLLAVVASGCAKRTVRQGGTTMPSPEGCFIQVWDAQDFQGVTDYINGPRTYTNLRDLPGGRIWVDRIRSVKTGVNVRAIVYARENFQGASLRLAVDGDYPTLPVELSGHIGSIRLDCGGESPGKVQ